MFATERIHPMRTCASALPLSTCMLGTANGVSVAVRQAFVGGNYGLLNIMRGARTEELDR